MRLRNVALILCVAATITLGVVLFVSQLKP